jgi:hypothetical protein
MSPISVAIASVLVFTSISTLNVYAGGPRDDYPGDATDDEADCWVNGYDDGFAGIYDADRGSECEKIGDDNYDYLWNIGCRDAGFHPRECENIRD